MPFSTLTYVSLAPIIFGVAMTAVTELAFDFWSFASALVSNVCFESRALLTKRTLPNSVHVVQLYVYLSAGAFLLCLPFWTLTEAVPVWRAMDFSKLPSVVACGFFHYAYNQVSFTFLSFVDPLTHAICNVLRRIFVVLYAIVYFGDVPPTQNLVGIAIVFIGVVLYLRSTTKPSATPAAAAAAASAAAAATIAAANGTATASVAEDATRQPRHKRG